MLIGISGYARSGKDSLGAFLVEDHGFTRLAFATLMKEALYNLNPIISLQPCLIEGGGWMSSSHTVAMHVDTYGWEKAKEHPEVRALLQRLGTEVGRELFGTDFWVDTAFRTVEDVDDVVVTDVRFPNEADGVRARGGLVIRIERPGVTAPNDHASEHALAGYDFDLIVNNNGTLDDLGNVATALKAAALTHAS